MYAYIILLSIDNYFGGLKEELSDISHEINQHKNEVARDFNNLNEVMSSYLMSLDIDDDFVM